MNMKLLIASLMAMVCTVCAYAQPEYTIAGHDGQVVAFTAELGQTCTRTLTFRTNIGRMEWGCESMNVQGFRRTDSYGDAFVLDSMLVISFAFTPTENKTYYDTVMFMGMGGHTEMFVLIGTVGKDGAAPWYVELSQLNFQAYVGDTTTNRLYISNVNDASAIRAAIRGYKDFSCDTSAIRYDDNRAYVDVSFHPKLEGIVGASLDLTGFGRVTSIELVGMGKLPVITDTADVKWEADTIWFMVSAKNQHPEISIRLDNRDTTWAVLTAYTIGGAAERNFTVEWLPMPIPIEPGGSTNTARVRCTSLPQKGVAAYLDAYGPNVRCRCVLMALSGSDTIETSDTIAIRVQNSTGTAGSVVNARVVLESFIPPLYVGGELTYSYASSVMVPEDQEFVRDGIVDGRRHTTYAFVVGERTVGSILVSKPFRLTIGDVSSSDVVVERLTFHDREGTELKPIVKANGAVVTVEDSDGRTIDAMSPMSLQVTPQPVTNTASVRVVKPEGEARLAIYDVSGTIVMDLSGQLGTALESTIDVPLSQLSPGLYVLRLSVGIRHTDMTFMHN